MALDLDLTKPLQQLSRRSTVHMLPCPCRFAEFALLEQPSSESLGRDSPPSHVQIVVQVSVLCKQSLVAVCPAFHL